MTIILDKGFFFDFAYLSLAPTPVLTYPTTHFQLIQPPTHPNAHPTGKVTGKLGRAKEAKQKAISLY